MTLLGLLIGAFLGFFVGDVGGSVAGGLLGTVGGIILEVRNATKGRKNARGLEARVETLETSLRDLQKTVSTLQRGSQHEDVQQIKVDEVAPSDTAPTGDREEVTTGAGVSLNKDVPPEEVGGSERGEARPFVTPHTSPPDIATPARGQTAEPEQPPPTNTPRASADAPRSTLNVWRSKLLTFLTGGNTVARVGVVVLLIGLAFLVQFAASQGYLPLELRLAGVALIGVVLTVLGWRLKASRRLYALTLQGGGGGVMYLSVFASLQYDLIPSLLGFALLVLLAVFSAVLAVAQDALSLAVLGILGGFLAPIFASDRGGSHVLLLSYYLILNVGILSVAWFKAWRALNLLGFWFTLVLGGLWGGLNYEPALFASTEPFLILFFLLYVAVAVLYALRQPPKLRGLVDGTLVFALPLVVFSLQAALVQRYDFGLAWSAFALGAFYLGLAWALFRYGPSALRLLVEAFVAVGLGFVTLTLPFALGASWTGVGWALEGAGLVWVGVRQRRMWLRLSGMALQGLAAVALILGTILENLFSTPSLDSMFAFNAALLALSSLFVAYHLFHAKGSADEVEGAPRDNPAHGPHLRRWEGKLSPVFLSLGLLWWSLAGYAQLSVILSERFTPYALLFFLTLTALGCTLLSPRLRWPTLALPALALLPVMVGALLSADPLHPFATLGWLTWPFTLGSFYWILRRTPQLIEGLANLFKLLHASALWFVTLLVGLELTWLGSSLRGEAWSLIGFGLALAGVTFLITQVMTARIQIPTWLKEFETTYLTLGLAPIALLLWLWGVGVNLNSGDAAPLPYVPLLNPLELTQAFALLALVVLFSALRRTTLAPAQVRMVTWALIVFGVLGSSTVLARTVHHLFGVPYDLPALYASSLLQASLAIFWTVFALAAMLFATRTQRRTAWLVGAGLLALVVAKLFFVDLASVGTVARIVSFVGVGALLLLIAYVAPAPPKEKTARQPLSDSQ